MIWLLMLPRFFVPGIVIGLVLGALSGCRRQYSETSRATPAPKPDTVYEGCLAELKGKLPPDADTADKQKQFQATLNLFCKKLKEHCLKAPEDKACTSVQKSSK